MWRGGEDNLNSGALLQLLQLSWHGNRLQPITLYIDVNMVWNFHKVPQINKTKHKHKHLNKGFALVMFFRGIPVFLNPPPYCIQSGWDTDCESPPWTWRCSGTLNKDFAVVKFDRGIPVFSNPLPGCIQSGWDTSCESSLWIWRSSGNLNSGFAVVKFYRGIPVFSNPPPCCIQSEWDTACESPLWIRQCSGNFIEALQW